LRWYTVTKKKSSYNKNPESVTAIGFAKLNGINEAQHQEALLKMAL